MQRSFTDIKEIDELFARETGYSDDVLLRARETLRGNRGFERMRLVREDDGFRVLLTAHGMELLERDIAKARGESASVDSTI